VICSILTFLAFAAFIGRKKENYTGSKDNVASVLTIRDKAIMGGNILWIIALLSLFIAVIYPIYQSFFYENNVAIDPEYFHQVFIPIFIPLMLIAAIIPYLNNSTSLFRKLIHLLIPFLITLVICHYIPKPSIISTAIIFASTLLMIQMTNLFLIESNYFQKSLTPRKLSLIIGHFSLGLLAFSININVLFSKEIEFIGKTGESVSDEFFLVKLDNIRFSNTEVYYRQTAEFSVQDNNGNVVILKPENRLYKIENTLSQESDIYSYLTHDMLASLSKVNGNTIHAIIYYKPMICFIWLSIFLIASSFVIYITKIK
jgi:cytochrome c-type biogenesis protein CcmF